MLTGDTQTTCARNVREDTLVRGMGSARTRDLCGLPDVRGQEYWGNEVEDGRNLGVYLISVGCGDEGIAERSPQEAAAFVEILVPFEVWDRIGGLNQRVRLHHIQPEHTVPFVPSLTT